MSYYINSAQKKASKRCFIKNLSFQIVLKAGRMSGLLAVVLCSSAAQASVKLVAESAPNPKMAIDAGAGAIGTGAVAHPLNSAPISSASSPHVMGSTFNKFNPRLSRHLNPMSISISETSTVTSTLSPNNEADYQTQFADLDDIDAVAHDDDIEEGNDAADFEHNIDLPSAAPYKNSANEVSTLEAKLDLTAKHVPLNAIAPETVQTFVEVIDTVRHAYVKPVNDEALFQYAIAGMLQKLDAHAEYLTPSGYERLRGFTDGEIAQVGLSADYDANKKAWVVDTILPKSSAKESGVKLGEQLLRIKTVELTADMSRQDIEQLLSGIAGSHVQIEIADMQGITRTIVMERNLPKSNQLEVAMQNGVAIVRLPIFQNSTKNQLMQALRQIEQPIIGLVLDVRNNPGGVLSAAIDVASLFIEDEGLIQVRNRTNSSQIIRPNGTPYLLKVPVVLLQNRYSASASEVLASSLKSNQRGLIIGEGSFGKGTVQEVIPLEVGGAVKLTVAEYRSATGETIDGIGIVPDITLVHDGANWQQQAVTILLSQNDKQFSDLDLGQDNGKVINDY